MTSQNFAITLFCLVLLQTTLLFGESGAQPAAEGSIFTLWPFVDYRESPADGFCNLAILGPLFKSQTTNDTSDLFIRPIFSRSSNRHDDSTASDYFYPLASAETAPDVSRFQVLRLYQKDTFRKDQEADREQDFMIFPFIITGTSRKYGPFTSVFPLYGDIYERFWRDEYHYVLFPLYSRTVKKGTTNLNILYPFFSTTSGDRESGFQFWPLYGQAAKEGVYRKRFALWPIFMSEDSALDTDNPVSKRYLLPLYVASDSPNKSSRSYLWPFFSHSVNRSEKEEGWDLLWPFWRVVRGEHHNVTSFLPLYSTEQEKEDRKTWYLWPLYKEETLTSPSYRQEKERLLYFLFTDNREEWPADGATKRRTALWPLFVYNRDQRGIKSLGFPAPVEPILNKDGIERNWAPLWRLYQQKWNDSGDSAVSFIWNLYWHERRGDSLAYELFPLLRYRNMPRITEVQILKGLVNYRQDAQQSTLRLLWLPFGFSWHQATEPPSATATVRSKS